MAGVFVVDGDSLSATSNIPYSAQLSFPANWLLYNVAVAGTQLSNMLANAGISVDPKHVAGADNIVAILGGTNDCVTGKSNATSIADLLSYASGRHAAGFKVIAITLPSLQFFDSCRDGLNTLIVANAASFDAIVRLDLDPHIGPDGTWADTNYFLDGRHPTHLAVNTIFAPLVQAQANALIP